MAIPEGYIALGFVGFTDKGDYDPAAVYMQNDLVHLNNAIWKCNVDNTYGIAPEENDNWTIHIQSEKDMDGITVTDQHGILGEAGDKVNAESLVNELAAPDFEDYTGETTQPDARAAISGIKKRVKLPVLLQNIKAALAGLVTLGEIRELLVNDGTCTEVGKYFLDAAYGKTLTDMIKEQNSNFQTFNHNLGIIGAGATVTKKIVFGKAFVDADYTIFLQKSSVPAYWASVELAVSKKEADGFTVTAHNTASVATDSGIFFDWFAFKYAL